MNSTGIVRIEALNKSNYDTWKMQMEALLIKNDAWGYVNGTKPKPEIVAGDTESEVNQLDWMQKDSKAKSDLILSIHPSELKQIKGCQTSRELWLKLESIYQSKGPARKTALLKRLMLQKMQPDEDVHEFMRKFFDAVDKLEELEVTFHPDVLSTMLLYSLPSTLENFRCAIESRDELPSPENLRIKIVEEINARKNTPSSSDGQLEALAATKKGPHREQHKHGSRKKSGMQCHKCGKFGHFARECRSKSNRQSASAIENQTLYADVADETETAFRTDASRDRKWIFDSGCTAHMCKDASAFKDIARDSAGKLNLASNASAKIQGKGSVVFKTASNGKTVNLQVTNALHVPELRENLLSISKMTDRGLKVVFDKQKAKVVDWKGQVKLTAQREGNLYLLYEKRGDDRSRASANSAEATEATKQSEIWHRRLGHLNVTDLRSAVKHGAIRGIESNLNDDFDCSTCLRGKLTRPPFPKESTRKTDLLDIVHSDVCGPFRTESKGGAKYFITFIDDASRWCEVRFLKHKDEALAAFKAYKLLIENARGRKIKFLQSDNGREYTNREFKTFLTENGIQQRLSTTYTPQQNGVAERMNRTLVESARCSLLQTNLPLSFWAEAVSTACYVRNRCPSAKLDGRTPFEIWIGHTPNVSYFKSFGCEVYCLNKMPGKGKLQARGRKGTFLGYSLNSKAYRVWLDNEKKVEITRDVRFTKDATTHRASLEDLLLNKEGGVSINVELGRITGYPEVTTSGEDAVIKKKDEANDDAGTSSKAQLKRGPGRPKKIKTGKAGRPAKQYQRAKDADKDSEAEVNDAACMAEVPLNHALSGADANEWMEAMASEVKSLIENDTWVLEERREDHKVIGSRIVLRNKYGPDGRIDRRKARLVAQGFSQRRGVDFEESFAPVARLSTVRLACSLAAHHHMKIRQVDITTAYLNGTITEEVIMEPPKLLEEILDHITRAGGTEKSTYLKAKKMLNELRSGNRVCRVTKALYGLKQAGRSWYNRLSGELKTLGARSTEADPCLYYLGEGGDLTLIVVYVDDLLVMSQNPANISEVIKHLGKRFQMKDLGEAKYCLGLEFQRQGDSVILTQRRYAEEILQRFRMDESRPVSTPCDVGLKLTKSDQERSEADRRLPYRELVGSLMYLAVATRPDLAYIVSHLSQFNSCYDSTHWSAAKRVLRYLRGTTDIGLKFDPGDASLIGFVDADWAGCVVDRRSYTGYAFLLGGGAVSWDARKQRTVALSSTEAEYMALTEASKEAAYLQRLLHELGIRSTEPVTLKCDSMGAQKLGKNPVHHRRTKHIDVKHHFVREALQERLVTVSYVSTTEMVADIMTKGLAKSKHEWCARQLGLRTFV